MLKRLTYILLLFLLAVPTHAKRVKTEPVTTDTRRQRLDYYFYEAERCLKMGEYDAAFALFEYCETLDKNNAAVEHNLGLLYQGMNRMDRSTDYLRRAFEHEPMAYWSDYANALWYSKQYKQAEKVLLSVVKNYPDQIDAITTLEEVYVSSEMMNPKKALGCIDKLEKRTGVTAYSASRRYRLLLYMHKNKEAAEVIDNYLLLNPDDDRFRLYKAELMLEEGKPVEAFRLYQEEKRLHPDNADAYLHLVNYYLQVNDTADALKELSDAMTYGDMTLQRKLTVVNIFRSVLLTDNDLFRSILLQLVQQHPLEVDAHKQLSEFYSQEHEERKALEEMYIIRQLTPNDEQAYQKIYDQLLKMDSTLTEQKQIINEASATFPKSLKWQLLRATAALTEQQTDSALLILQTAAEITNPTEQMYMFAIYALQGDLFMQQEQYEQCFEAYEKALALNPDNIYVLNNYAYTLALYGNDLKKAEAMSQKTIKKEPDNPTYLDTYAWILHLRGDDAFALFYIKQAMEKMKPDEDNKEILSHYQQIIDAQNNKR